MKITEIPAKPKERKTIRVAAYARVSSDKDAAFHSLEAQTEYYEDYVAAHPDWELVSIYSDNGISGTIINRPEFQRMLEDCRAGKIDLVVTKSVTRFARNTVVLLETVRELKRLGVDCYFEKEDMHSISPDGELLLTLLAMYAEEEARSASENQKWRIKKKFERGIPTSANMLGYKLEDGKMVIVPEEAEIVRQIFSDYLSGMGLNAIAKKLAQNCTVTRFAKKWSSTGISKILSNEKYIGNLMLQKKYRSDFRTKKTIENHGEKKMYYVEGSHEAIIDRETFEAVKIERAKRQIYRHPQKKKDSNENLFMGMVTCGICGHRYSRKCFCGKYGKTDWLCYEFLRKGRDFCPSQKVPEVVLIQKTKEVLNTSELTRDVIHNNLRGIIVAQHNQLTYVFKDNSRVDILWEYPSRSTSWTEEMRQKAREKSLAQWKERKENAKGNNN